MKCFKKLLVLKVVSLLTFELFAQSVIPIQTGTNSYNYIVDSHPLPTTEQAQFTYLWWFGDGGFSFEKNPSHSFVNTPSSGQYNGKLVLTESYGTGGVPPMHYHSSIDDDDTPPRSVTDILNDKYIKLQHYRNAVPNDTLYLIVTYKAPLVEAKSNNIHSNYSGIITLSYDQELLDFNVDNNTSEHYPKGEQINSDLNSWNFHGLGSGIETSFLVALKCPEELVNRIEEKIEVRAVIEFDTGIEAFDVVNIPIAKSHDPNQMLNNMAQNENCDIGGETIRYHIDFENIGDISTSFIKLAVDLDKHLDLSSITNIASSKEFKFHSGSFVDKFDSNLGEVLSTKLIPSDHQLQISLNRFRLESGHVLDKTLNKGWVEFDINIQPDYILGPEIISQTHIYFDANDPISTNRSVINCESSVPTSIENYNHKGSSIKLLKAQPNPSSRRSAIVFQNNKIQKLDLSIIDLNGRLIKAYPQKIYEEGKQEIILDLSDLGKGMYLIILSSSDESYMLKLGIDN